ncbi:MAG: (d)CMP kinase [Bacteroidetes bacterium]|nr:(d)CMP kinase [Bacteroidota bacterium]
MKKIIIAIDGPAASGKSTTAKLVASKLNYLHIDTGAMYRAMALKVLRNKISPDDAASIAHLTETTTVRLVFREDKKSVDILLDNEVVNDEIRTLEVTNIVSNVSIVPEVRIRMVDAQRAMGAEGGIVLEGRDIGTVVFPNAELKIFMVANPRERAKRRLKELNEKNISVTLEDLEREILERDMIDSNRELSPLKKADDAFVLDTTNLSIEEQVEVIVEKAKKIIGG